MSLIPLGRLIVSFDGPSARQQDIHTAIAIQIGALRHQPAGARLDERFHVRRYLVVVQVREEGVLRRAMPHHATDHSKTSVAVIVLPRLV
jgi:hypothetical protein